MTEAKSVVDTIFKVDFIIIVSNFAVVFDIQVYTKVKFLGRASYMLFD